MMAELPYPFIVMVVASAVLTFAMIALRQRASWSPIERNVALVQLAVALGFPILGFVEMLRLRAAFDAAKTADPALKADLLAKQISGSMTSLGLGLLLGMLAFIPAVVGLISSGTRSSRVAAGK
jgi:hypothetical protein